MANNHLIDKIKLHLDFIPDATQRRRRNWAAFLLIFMSMQHAMFEGVPLSWPKMITMAISPFVLIGLGTTKFSKGFWLGVFYWLTICLTSWIHPYPVNHMSIWFTLPFILLFGTYHTLLTYHVFSLRDFEKILQWVIGAYIVFLFLQQLCYFVGIHRIVLFNRYVPLGFKFQSLGLEPSYAARIIGAYVFAYLEVLRLKHGKDLSFSFLWMNYRNQLIGIVYFFATLGSGTAWGVLAALAAYIAWHGQRLLAIIGLLVIFMMPSEQIDARDRLVNALEATMTLDAHTIWEVDRSAAHRILVLFNFITGFKPWLEDFWFGQGAYTVKFQNVGIIMLYGFIAWLMQILQFSICCFRRLFSFEVLYFIIFVTLCVGNVVNLWAIMMVFATVKYFSNQKLAN